MKKSIEEALSLDDLKKSCLHCKNCGLADTRQNVVFGEGRANADIFLLGEAPGAHEDETGRPFVGRAGELLNRLLAAAGLERDHVFITGSTKCRPPKNRNPYRNELTACYPYLERQLALIRPKVVICLGLVAVQNLLNTRVKMADVRGCWFEGPSYRILPTYHPAAVLRGTVKQEVLIQDFIMVAARVKAEKR